MLPVNNYMYDWISQHIHSLNRYETVSRKRTLPRIVFSTKLESIFFSSGKLNVWYLFATLSISTAKLLIIWETSFIYHLRFTPSEVLLHQFLILLRLRCVAPRFICNLRLRTTIWIYFLSIMFAFLRRYEKIFPTRHFVVQEYQYFGFLSGFLSSGEVLGEIFDYGQYIIHPETLCRTERYTDTILALTAYIHGHSEQMPLPPNIACGTLPSITLVSIENSPVYIPCYIPYEDTYCTGALPHPYKVAPFAGSLPYRINWNLCLEMNSWPLEFTCLFINLPRIKLTFF